QQGAHVVCYVPSARNGRRRVTRIAPEHHCSSVTSSGVCCSFLSIVRARFRACVRIERMSASSSAPIWIVNSTSARPSFVSTALLLLRPQEGAHVDRR